MYDEPLPTNALYNFIRSSSYSLIYTFMRKLVLQMRISADGFVGGPNGEIDWLLRTMDNSAIAWIEDTLWQAGVHIMGSRTFYDMINYWPTSSNPLAKPMNEIPKIVFSKKRRVEISTIEQTTQALKDSKRLDLENGINPLTKENISSWEQAQIASGDLLTEISALKKQDGKFILAHGGAGFAQSLVGSGLIDEYRLLIHPVILGQGLPLFSAALAPLYLQLESSIVLNSGIIANIYTPKKLSTP